MSDLTKKQKALKKAASKFFNFRSGYERAEFKYLLWKLTGKKELRQLSEEDIAVATRRLELKLNCT